MRSLFPPSVSLSLSLSLFLCVFVFSTDAAHAVAQVEESQDDIVRGLKLEKDIDLILNNDVGDEDESLKVLLNALHTYYN